MQVGSGGARRAFELGKGLFLPGDDGDVVTEAAGSLERQKRKPAVAGNQTDFGHWWSKDTSRSGPMPWARQRSLSFGVGEEMLRGIACGLVLAALVAVAACSDTTVP